MRFLMTTQVMPQVSSTLRRSWWHRPSTREALIFYLCLTPWIVGFLLFVAGPMFASIFISLSSWDIISPPRFVGLDNFVELLTDDEVFLKSLWVTTYYTLGSVPVGLVVGLLIALLMNVKLPGI